MQGIIHLSFIGFEHQVKRLTERTALFAFQKHNGHTALSSGTSSCTRAEAQMMVLTDSSMPRSHSLTQVITWWTYTEIEREREKNTDASLQLRHTDETMGRARATPSDKRTDTTTSIQAYIHTYLTESIRPKRVLRSEQYISRSS